MMAACPEGALYLTSSREVAAAARAGHGNVMASTGGPNTLVAPAMTEEISDAIKLSAMIENSGQCTALRHAVVPGATMEDLDAMFTDAPIISTPQDALRNGAFAGVFDGKHRGPFESLDGYKFAGESGNIAYKVSAEMPGDDLNEQWRQTYVDMTSFKGEFGSASMVKGLGEWLVKHQPISLAMNTTGGDLSWARSLFEQTGQVRRLHSEASALFTPPSVPCSTRGALCEKMSLCVSVSLVHTCCYDEIKGTQDLKIHSQILSLPVCHCECEPLLLELSVCGSTGLY